MLSVGFGYTKALAGFCLRAPRAHGWPVSVAIEPSNVCNLHCPLCATGSNSLTRPKGCMSLEEFKRIIDGLPSSVNELYLWGQGEPFTAPDFLSMVSYASRHGLKTIVSTNGHFLDTPDEIINSGLDILIVSLDGADSDTYTSYRVGGDFNRVIKGIKDIAEAVKKAGAGPVIELQYLITSQNAGGSDAFRALARKTGAHHVVFKTLQASSMENGKLYLPDDTGLTRYRNETGGRLETDRWWFLKNRCFRLYHSLQIDWQGNVLPCCFDKDSTYIMGNIFRDSLVHIWNSPNYRSFRSTLNRHGRVFPMCKDCTEGLKKKYIK
jgi:radical SAM protein with 4Fe4S-binding SPASM domain